MSCINVTIQDLQDAECQIDETFTEIDYLRLFPIDPIQEDERGVKAIAIAYNSAGKELMRGTFWVKKDVTGHFTLTPCLPSEII